MHRVSISKVLVLSLLTQMFVQGQGSIGPAFTLPKTALALRLSVQKTLLVPGAFCEAADIFVPAMELNVECNGTLIRPFDLLEEKTLTNFSAALGLVKSISSLEGKLAKLTKQEEIDKAKAELLDKKKKQAELMDPSPTDESSVAKLFKEQLEKKQRTITAIQATLSNYTAQVLEELKPSEAALEQAGKEVEEAKQKVTALKADVSETKAQIEKANKQECGLLKGSCKDLKEKKEGLAAKLVSQAAELAKQEELLKNIQAKRDDTKTQLDKKKESKEVKDLEAKIAQAQEEIAKASDSLARLTYRAAFNTTSAKVQAWSVSSFGVPDPDFLDAIKPSDGLLVDNSNQLKLSEAGVIQGLESSRFDRTGEVILGVVKAAAGIFGRLFAGSGLRKTVQNQESSPVLEDLFRDEFFSTIESEFREAALQNFDLLDAQRRSNYALSYYSDSQARAMLLRARSSYGELANKYKNFQTLISVGVTPGSPLMVPVHEKRIEAQILADWAGEKTTFEWTPEYELTPVKSNNPSADAAQSGPNRAERLLPGQALFLFELGSCGVNVSGNDLAPRNAAPAKRMTCSAKQLADPDTKASLKKISVIVTRKGNTLAGAARENSSAFPAWSTTGPSNSGGLPYIIPEEAEIDVENSGLKVAKASVLLAQWGVATRLPKDYLKGNGGVTVTYYSATGAIQDIKMSTKSALEGKTVEAIGDSVLKALGAKMDADKAASEAQRNASDPLLLLQKEQKIREAQLAIQTACEKLQSGCVK